MLELHATVKGATDIDFKHVFRSMPAPMLMLRPDDGFAVVEATDAWLRETSMPRDAVVGRRLFEVFPGLADDPGHEGASSLRAAFESVLANKSAETTRLATYVISRKTGRDPEERYWRAVNSPVLSDDGEVQYIIHRFCDEGGASGEEQVRLISESETKRRIYEAALSNTPDLVYVFDLEHRFMYANEALLAMWGRSREDALGKTCLQLGYEPWHAAMHDREIDQVVATHQPIRGEVPFTGTGGRRVYDYILVPVIGPDGEVVAVAGTTRDITDRQRTEQAIREQAARLSASDRAKDEFLAVLAHELRNPLAPLRNSLSLLRMTHTGDAAAATVHEMMDRQVNHLIRLVDDLLEMSRISRGALTLQKERVEVAAIVRNAIETSTPLINSAGHALDLCLPEQPLWLDGDPVRLSQILANLLNNAAKYTKANGQISVTVRSEADSATISVLDNGVGIAPDLLPVMFDMFSRGERADGNDELGLGIGLALARRLAEMHSGTLTARSDGIGRGSEFVMRLPLAGAEGAVSVSKPSHTASISRQRILVVDDNRDAADSLGLILEYLGAEVRIARDGTEALSVFGNYAPAVVLLDIGMPGLDGYEVARTIRERHPGSRATLIALTGWGQEHDRRRAREAGFDHHLIKPAEVGALQALLSSLPIP